MRKLLGTLYVTTPDAYLSLDGENIVISVKQEEIKRIPLHNLENIVSFGYQGASPALMRHVCECGIGMAFFKPSGQFMCRVEGERHGNVLLRREQYRIADDEKRSLPIARNMIGAKTVNARTVLNRFMRDHPMAYDNDRVLSAAEYLKESLPKIHESPDTDTLRGYEGVNATCYFGVFDSMILQNKDVFSFSTREKRPPTDPVNALLSFSYTILANDCASALESVGLDPVCRIHAHGSLRQKISCARHYGGVPRGNVRQICIIPDKPPSAERK